MTPRDPLAKLSNYLLAHQGGIDMRWVGKVIEEVRTGLSRETPPATPLTEAEARKWCDEHRKHPVIGKAIQGAQSWQPDGLAVIVAHIFNLAHVEPEAQPQAPAPKYPQPCGICDGVIQSEADLDWHGYGNCRDIPDIVMADLNIAQLLRDLQGHIAGELGERLDKAVTSLTESASSPVARPAISDAVLKDYESQQAETRAEAVARHEEKPARETEATERQVGICTDCNRPYKDCPHGL